MIYIQKYAWGFALGLALSLAGWSPFWWEFYAAIIPIILLVIWSKSG